MKKKQLIIDASCIMAVISDEEDRNIVLEKADGYELLSAECLPFEVCNGISKMIKRNVVSVEEGLNLYAQFKNIDVTYIKPEFEKTIHIAGEEKHYCYDMFYVENAISLGLPILSLDKKLLMIAEQRGIKCL